MTIMTHQAPLPLSTPLVEREPRCWTFSHGSTIGLHWIEAIKRLLKPIKTPGLEEGHLHNHSMTLCLEVGCGSTPVPSCPGRWVVWVSISAECLFKPIASLPICEVLQKMRRRCRFEDQTEIIWHGKDREHNVFGFHKVLNAPTRLRRRKRSSQVLSSFFNGGSQMWSITCWSLTHWSLHFHGKVNLVCA